MLFSKLSGPPAQQLDTADVLEEFRRLTGPVGSGLTDGGIAAEMRALGVTLPEDRIRRLRTDAWVSLNRTTYRGLHDYVSWKRRHGPENHWGGGT